MHLGGGKTREERASDEFLLGILTRRLSASLAQGEVRPEFVCGEWDETLSDGEIAERVLGGWAVGS